MFSTCPFVRSSVRLSVCSSVTNLWTLYFENKWTDFNANWHKFPQPGARAWSFDLETQRSKVKVIGGRSYVWKPGWDIILDPLSWLDRGMQWATEMLPLKTGEGRGVAHSFNCNFRTCRICVLLTHLLNSSLDHLKSSFPWEGRKYAHFVP